MRRKKIHGALLGIATSSLLLSASASAQDWIVSLDAGPVAPVKSCIVVEDEDGFHHIANGTELPPGFICDEDIGAIGGNSTNNPDPRKVDKSDARKWEPARPIKGCRNGDKCPSPRAQPRR